MKPDFVAQVIPKIKFRAAPRVHTGSIETLSQYWSHETPIKQRQTDMKPKRETILCPPGCEHSVERSLPSVGDMMKTCTTTNNLLSRPDGFYNDSKPRLCRPTAAQMRMTKSPVQRKWEEPCLHLLSINHHLKQQWSWNRWDHGDPECSPHRPPPVSPEMMHASWVFLLVTGLRQQ